MARDLAYRSVAHSQVSMCSERRKDKIALLIKNNRKIIESPTARNKDTDGYDFVVSSAGQILITKSSVSSFGYRFVDKAY